MRVLIVSKALINASYRGKLTELAALGVEVVAAVPPEWRESGGVQRLERNEDIAYQLIEAPLRLNGHFHLHHYPTLNRLIGEIGPDLVHLDEEPYNAATYLGARAARRARIPVVFFSWQNLFRRYPPPFSWMERSVYRWAAHAIAGGDEAGSILRAKGYRGGLSIVPQFGVDEERFRPGPAESRPFTVGFYNRMIPGKAPLLSLDAFAKLPRCSRMRFVGDGPLYGDVEREILRRGMGDRVTLQRRLPSAEMPALMRETDVLVLPSVTMPNWKEQFGRVLIEAMASGVPVVGSDSGEIPNVVGDAGLIVPEGDGMALAAALRRLQSDSGLRGELGRLGRERVMRRFTHRRIAEGTVEAYEKAVEQG